MTLGSQLVHVSADRGATCGRVSPSIRPIRVYLTLSGFVAVVNAARMTGSMMRHYLSESKCTSVADETPYHCLYRLPD